MPPKRVDPICGIIIVADVGPSSSKQNGKGLSQAARIKEFLLHLIQQKIFMNNCDEIGIVLFGTEDTNNPLFKGGNSLFYKNIVVLDDMNKASWIMAKTVEEAPFEPSNVHGDWIEALQVSLNLIQQRIQVGVVYEKTQIVVITDFESPSQTKDKERFIVSSIKDLSTILYFINSSLKQETVDAVEQQENNSGALFAKYLVENIEGSGCGDIEELISSVLLYSGRPTTKGTPWNAMLEIGNEIKIPVSGYIKASHGSHTTWKEGTINDEPIEKEKVYKKISAGDDDENVDRQDIIPAYKYGSKYFSVTADTEERFDYRSGCKCLTVVAFIDPIPHHLFQGNSTMYFFANKAGGVVDKNAQKALSAIINGMMELGRDALVRRVYQNNSRVQLGVLSPRIKLNYECLVYHELPFADDVRKFDLPPIITPKHSPKTEQLNIVDDLIDKFNLPLTEDQDLCSYESTKIVDMYEEYVRHMVGFKGLHPEDDLPSIPSHIKCFTKPQPSVLQSSQDVLQSIKSIIPLVPVNRLKVSDSEAAKRVVPATAAEDELDNPSKKMRSDENGVALGVMAILGGEVVKIGTGNPIDDFFQLLKIGKKPKKDIYEEMENIILSLLRDSHGTNIVLMNKSRECLVAYRQHALEGRNPKEFNSWMERFKSYVIANFFQDFWQRQIVDKRIGLITWDESDDSLVDQQQAKHFFQLPHKMEAPSDQSEHDEDMSDLI